VGRTQNRALRGKRLVEGDRRCRVGEVAGPHLGEPKVEQLDAGRGRQDIPRLQIAMRNPQAVGGVERIAYLRPVPQCRGDRKRPAQWLPVDVLHDEIIGSDVVEGANIRMV